MKSETLKYLHNRQSSIVEMITKCDNRIKENQDDLLKPCYYLTIPNEIKRNIEKLKRVKERLVRWYIDIQIRIMTLHPEIELTTSTEMDMATMPS